MPHHSAPFTTRPELTGHFGMVAATHYLGSAAGMAILERGGNAFDAAVATGFVLQVVEPHLNGPGGDMSLIFAVAGGPPTVLCGQGPAPASASMDAFQQMGLAEIPGSGLTCAAIPGSTVAWLTLLRDHGTITVEAALDAAIAYASRGYPVLPQISDTIGRVADLLRSEWTSSAAQYLPGGAVPAAGSMLTNPALAETFRRLVEASRNKGREAGIEAAMDCWREGFVAQAVEDFCRQPAMDTSGERHTGFLTGADMAAFQPGYEEPCTASFGSYTVAKTGPWGQGPVLLQQLRMLDGFDADPMGIDFVHTIVEGAKLALADRNAFYGDSGPVPMAALLADDYTTRRRGMVSERASMDLRPGSPDGWEPRFPRHGAAKGVIAGRTDGTSGEPTVPAAAAAIADVDPKPSRLGGTNGDTCHIDVVDRFGNMVSATPSGGWLQSSPMVPALGFPLGTRLQMMTLDRGLPTSLTPGRRPRTTLSPTMVLADGVAVMACGTPGGDQQDQWQVPFLLRYLVHGWGLQRAIDAPTFHTTHVPGSFHPHDAQPGELVIESRCGEAVLGGLRKRGHGVTESGPWTLGRLSAVTRDPASGLLRAGANPRGMQGYAAGR